MINKHHFGKRIAECRKKLMLSQTELAEKLGVTSQAVSKWECGLTLPDIDLLLDLSKLYDISINELLEDSNIIAKIANCGYKSDIIAYFVDMKEKIENKDWANEIVKNHWVSKNWDSAKNENFHMEKAGGFIAECNGIILEIGAGPGGGFVPYILKSNPNAMLIISDLSPTVVKEWKKLLDKEMNFPNMSYAAFNFCKIPFFDNSIDVISDGGGIGNTEDGEKSKALKECFRVLKPGGLLVTSTGFVNKETFDALPTHAQSVLKEKRPDVFRDLNEETILAGFTDIRSVICGGWETDNDDSTIADLARSLGVNLKFTAYIRYCTK